MCLTEQLGVTGLVRGWGRWTSSLSERDTRAPSSRFGRGEQVEAVLGGRGE